MVREQLRLMFAVFTIGWAVIGRWAEGAGGVRGVLGIAEGNRAGLDRQVGVFKDP